MPPSSASVLDRLVSPLDELVQFPASSSNARQHRSLLVKSTFVFSRPPETVLDGAGPRAAERPKPKWSPPSPLFAHLNGVFDERSNGEGELPSGPNERAGNGHKEGRS